MWICTSKLFRRYFYNDLNDKYRISNVIFSITPLYHTCVSEDTLNTAKAIMSDINVPAKVTKLFPLFFRFLKITSITAKFIILSLNKFFVCMSIADVVAEKLFLVEKYVSVSAAAMYFIEKCIRGNNF